MHSKAQSAYWGKYREIVIAVACFLLFDIAVLTLNFYISSQLSDSATAINLAGRQRMLSQRMTKELLSAQQDRQQAVDSQSLAMATMLQSLREMAQQIGVASGADAKANGEQARHQRAVLLKLQQALQNQAPTALQTVDISTQLSALQKTAALFDTTLGGFEVGGTVAGGDGQQAHLNAIQSPAGRDILHQADVVWGPLHQMVTSLGDKTASPEDLAAATAYARDHNLELLNLMNKLTTDLQHEADGRADFLRLVQTAGIILALLNFAYILGKCLNRLRSSDREIEQAQRETAEILSTVKEGLFLLGQDFRIGSQYSSSLAKILGRPVAAGGDFQDILGAMVTPDVLKSACEYIRLLLGDRVKESLVQDLNPLNQIEVNVPDEQGGTQRRYLSLHFSRVLQDGRISHLLVTVFDVTTQVELGQALAEARKKAKAEVEVMLDLLKVNPAMLKHYLDGAEKALLEINDQLRHVVGEKDYRRTISQIFRQVHTLKGEAAALGLEIFEETAQQFELLLSGLRSKGAVSGSDLLALPLPLDEFLQRIANVREVSQRLAAYQASFHTEDDQMNLAASLDTLAQRIARDQGKRVQLTTELADMSGLPAQVRQTLNDIALQLLRNAVVHGIEDGAERTSLAKPAVGNIHISLRPVDDEFEFVMRDDGRGLRPEHIRAELLRRGSYTQAQLQDMSDHQIIHKIFEPGFSTASEVSRDAGQGVGLDVVKHKIEELGARLRIASRKDAFTQFCIRFAA